MILKAIIDDQMLTLNVPGELIIEAGSFFEQMDEDMDRGWQMSREWVPYPDKIQRCQIVANKLLTALENENHRLGRLMAGYILSRMPEVETVEVDTSGEIDQTRFTFREASSPTARPSTPSAGMDKLAAMEQAGKDVTQVFKVGKGWRFSVYDHAKSTWAESPTFATQQEADDARAHAFKRRFDELTGRG
jgi:hypothetical protein